MWCLRMRWYDQCFHLTKDCRVEEVPADSDKVRLFHSEDSARQFIQYGLGVVCDLYPAYVGAKKLEVTSE